MNQPLVSVCVIAYNSSSFILHTLQSIEQQTYSPIELIISDDCSTDHTVALCSEWLTNHNARFVSVRILTSLTNDGISPNVNRACRASQGEWVKCIAADDMLHPNCIADNVAYITSHPESHIVVSRMKVLYEEEGNTQLLDEPFLDSYAPFYEADAARQYRLLLRENYISAPTAFIKRATLALLNYTDERYPFIEDYPLWLKFTSSGYRVFFLDKPTVTYRMNHSVTRSAHVRFHPSFYHSQRLFVKEQLLPHYQLQDISYIYATYLALIQRYILFRLLGNKRNKLTCFVEKLFQKLYPHRSCK